MFGGLAFIVNGHMCCGVSRNDLVVRIGPGRFRRNSVSSPCAAYGFVYVAPEGCRKKDELRVWLQCGLDFVLSQAPKVGTRAEAHRLLSGQNPADQSRRRPHRRTFHRSKRTEYAAIARIGAQDRLAVAALVIELAGVHWHGFAFAEATARAGQDRIKNNLAHCCITFAPWRDSRRLWSRSSAFLVWSCRDHR